MALPTRAPAVRLSVFQVGIGLGQDPRAPGGDRVGAGARLGGADVGGLWRSLKRATGTCSSGQLAATVTAS